MLNARNVIRWCVVWRDVLTRISVNIGYQWRSVVHFLCQDAIFRSLFHGVVATVQFSLLFFRSGIQADTVFASSHHYAMLRSTGTRKTSNSLLACRAWEGTSYIDVHSICQVFSMGLRIRVPIAGGWLVLW